MNWTSEQERAITLRNKNILVAAAAGSGKTAVLVERIKRLIIEEGCPIDRMLIVTFTEAAASEMKQKIEKSIRNAISEDKFSEEQKSFLKRQLDLIPQANISTFHAFSLDVIKRYFYLINKEPNLKILDDARRTIILSESMEELFKRKFEDNDPLFIGFLKKFGGGRNDRNLKEMLLKAYETIRSLPEPFKWLEDAKEDLETDFEHFNTGKIMQYFWDEITGFIENCCKKFRGNIEFSETTGDEKIIKLAHNDLERAALVLNAIRKRDFEELRTIFGERQKLQSYPRGISDLIKEVLEPARREYKEGIDTFKEYFVNESLFNLYKGVSETGEDAQTIISVLKEFDEIFSAEKNDAGVVDFSDIEHFALEILKDEEASGFYRNKFRYIFVDEYQDSSVIQEKLISDICRENNLFLVGDVKQSIYKFRLAEPEIFQKRYRDYQREMDESGEASISEKIDLNANFRSKKSVIDSINAIFSSVMDDYDEKAALHAGAEKNEEYNYRVKTCLCQVPWTESEDIDDEIKELKKIEKEALCAVKLIKDSLGKEYYDAESHSVKQIELKDIVILMRSIKGKGDLFYKVLTENGIPAFVDDNDGYFNTMEIEIFMSLLGIIDNEKQDVQLLSVMRSEIGGFSINELCKIRIFSKTGSYYDAVYKYAESGEEDSLKKKICVFIEKISLWRDAAYRLPLEELVWKLLLESGFYVSMGSMPAGYQRQANLRALCDKAGVFRKSYGGSLYDFIKYIDAVKENKVPMGQVRLIGADENTVRIMTIHKSKGLEFPVVILSSYANELRYSGAKKEIMLHKDVGIGIPIVDTENSWYYPNAVQNAIRYRIRKEEVEENKRILYVALTRAKDMLYLLGTVKDVEAAKEKMTNEFKTTSFLGMTGIPISKGACGVDEISDYDLKNIAVSRRRWVGKTLGIIDRMKEKPDHVSDEIEKRLSFEYQFKDELEIKSKYSVSELVRESHIDENDLHEYDNAENDQAVFSKEKSFGDNKWGSLSASQVGTITHTVLEHIDFCRASDEDGYLDSLIDELVQKLYITREEAECISKAKIYSFAKSEMGFRLAEAEKRGKLFREKPFNMIASVHGSEATVQGIIDCFYEKDDGTLVLIDYKNSSVRNREILKKRYGKQIDIYQEALEKATGKAVSEKYLYNTFLDMLIEM